MNKQVDVTVLINGKQYTLSGYESEEYIQKIASYINSRCADIKQNDSYKHLDADMRNVLVYINIADDYFKLKKQLEDTAYISDSKSSEIFNLKHELVNLKEDLEEARKKLASLKDEKLVEEKKNIRLETELNEIKKNKKN